MKRRDVLLEEYGSPPIHFVWVGPIHNSFNEINQKSVSGPIALAQGTDSKFQIIYWVEREYVRDVTAVFEKYENVTVQCIDHIIESYCDSDPIKLSKTLELLKTCKDKNLPTVVKEILTPMLMARFSGYFIDTSIFLCSESVHLPWLDLPALALNLSFEKKQTARFFESQEESSLYPSGSDLYIYFSSPNPANWKESSESSATLFSDLANITIETWENYFKTILPRQLEDNLSIETIKIYMINNVLMHPIESLFRTKKEPSMERQYTCVLGHDESALKITPKIPFSKPEILTIDAVPSSTQSSLRLLYINGTKIGIGKIFSASWHKSFTQYLITELEDAILSKALSRGNDTINQINKPLGLTPLGIAIKRNQIEIVKRLLAAGADVNKKNAQGETPLNMAAFCGLNNIVQILAAHADINMKNDMGETSLEMAIMARKADVVQTLLDAGADFLSENEDGQTMLELAIIFGQNQQIIHSLLAAGADIQVQNERGKTLLNRAENKEFSPETNEAILAKGENPRP